MAHLFWFLKCSPRPPLWSTGQSSWLQIRRPGFDSRHNQKKRVVGLERGPLSFVSTIEELLDRKVAGSGSCLENRENTAGGIRQADHVAPLSAQVGNRFADKRRSLGRYSSLAGSDQVVNVPHAKQVSKFAHKVTIPLRSPFELPSTRRKSVIVGHVFVLSSQRLLKHSCPDSCRCVRGARIDLSQCAVTAIVRS
jgi:hypothetical protein